jgi:hypothetical protein
MINFGDRLARRPPLRRERRPRGPMFPTNGFCPSSRKEPCRHSDALAASEARADQAVCTLAVTVGANRFQQRHDFLSLRDRNHATVRAKREYVEGEKRTVAEASLYWEFQRRSGSPPFRIIRAQADISGGGGSFRPRPNPRADAVFQPQLSWARLLFSVQLAESAIAACDRYIIE